MHNKTAILEFVRQVFGIHVTGQNEIQVKIFYPRLILKISPLSPSPHSYDYNIAIVRIINLNILILTYNGYMKTLNKCNLATLTFINMRQK